MSRDQLFFTLAVPLCFAVWIVGCSRSSKSTDAPSFSSAGNSPSPPSESSMRFEDVTSSLELNHQYRNGEESNQFAYIESIGGGLAVFDFDRDGFQDLFFPGGGLVNTDHSLTPLPGTLWHNDHAKRFTNVTNVSHLDVATTYSNGVSSGDLNNDGFPDLLVTGYSGLQFFVNQGDGTFVETAVRSGLTDSLWSTSAGLGDLNNDGSLDIYIAHNTDWSWANNPECLGSATVRDNCAPAAFKRRCSSGPAIALTSPLPSPVSGGRSRGPSSLPSPTGRGSKRGSRPIPQLPVMLHRAIQRGGG